MIKNNIIKVIHIIRFLLMIQFVILINNAYSQTFQMKLSIDESDSCFSSNKMVVFEKYFNEDVKVFFKDSLLYDEHISTNFSTERVNQNYYIFGTDKNDSFQIESKGQFINIPIMAPRNIYIGKNRDGVWFIRYTNELRIYR